jgi:hypothetical protein
MSFTLKKLKNGTRLAQLAITLLKYGVGNRVRYEEQELRFNMHTFIGGADGASLEPAEITCGTSCCFLGYAPAVWPEMSQEDWTWEDVRAFVLDDDRDDNLFEFLFGGGWADDPTQAAARALHFLEGGEIRETRYSETDYSETGEWDIDCNAKYYPELNRKQLIERLSEFV